MKVGFYKDGMVDIDEKDVVSAAESFAESNRQILEYSDHNFTIFVEEDNGQLFEVSMTTEYTTSFHANNTAKVKNQARN